MNKTRKAYGYARVSTDRQSISLEAQTAKIVALGQLQDVTIAEIISDSESAKDTDRPGLQRLLGMVKAGEASAIVICKLDRLTRSVRDLCDLLDLFRKHDVALISVAESLDTNSAAGRMVIGILGVISEWERATISERTATALRHKKSCGKVYGKVPFGFERQGDNLIPLESEQTVIAKIRSLRAQAWTLARIAQAMTDERVPCKGGGSWYPSTVASILKVQNC